MYESISRMLDIRCCVWKFALQWPPISFGCIVRWNLLNWFWWNGILTIVEPMAQDARNKMKYSLIVVMSSHQLNFSKLLWKIYWFSVWLIKLGRYPCRYSQSCPCCSCRQLMLAGRVWRWHCPSHPLGIILPCHVACRSSLSLPFSSSSVKAVTLTGRICYKSFLMSIQCFHWVLYLCNVYFWISVCKNLRRTLYIMCTTFSIFTPIKEN